MADVFISYSRMDKDFVDALHRELKQQGRDAWVDWEDIPLTAKWWKEVQIGIETANSFVFVLSKNSVTSKVCRQEIDHAVKYNKRLIPVVQRQDFNTQEVHPAISSYNWIFFRGSDDFATNFKALIKAIDTDLNHVRMHTHLLTSAIEWNQKNQDSSFLLRGSALSEAEEWLSQNANREPLPTDLHQDYINASLSAETASLLYRNIVQLLKKVTGVFSAIRQNKRHLLPILIEWFFYLIATANILLVIFDLTYFEFRTFYINYLNLEPMVKLYDPYKRVETNLYTQKFIDTAQEVKSRYTQNPQDPEIPKLLLDLQQQSKSIIDTDPFARVGMTGNLEAIKNRIKEHMGNNSATQSFKSFWSLENINKDKESFSFYEKKLEPLFKSNYFRLYGEDGEFIDKFWQINLYFIGMFAAELLIRGVYISRRARIGFRQALSTRWYDFFWLIFTVHWWPWLRLLYLIPFLIRSYHVGLLSLIPNKFRRLPQILSSSNPDNNTSDSVRKSVKAQAEAGDSAAALTTLTTTEE